LVSSQPEALELNTIFFCSSHLVTDLLGKKDMAPSGLPVVWESFSGRCVVVAGECAPLSGGVGTEHEAGSLQSEDA
jgi:hypothetical protein